MMRIDLDEMKRCVRLLLDDVEHDGEVSDFTADADKELELSVETACGRILEECPYEWLEPEVVKVNVNGGEQDYDAIQSQYTDGHGKLVLPDDWLRLYELKLRSWRGSLRETLNPNSLEAMMQVSRWTCGTPQNPKGIVLTDKHGHRVLMYWKAGRYHRPQAGEILKVYDHTVELFTYIPKMRIENEEGSDGVAKTYVVVAMVDSDQTRSRIAYRAAGLYLASKGEQEAAGRMYGLSNFKDSE